MAYIFMAHSLWQIGYGMLVMAQSEALAAVAALEVGQDKLYSSMAS